MFISFCAVFFRRKWTMKDRNWKPGSAKYLHLIKISPSHFIGHLDLKASCYNTNILEHTGCLKKNGILWKNGHKYLQTHPKCKIWGCFWKFRIFATLWALRFSKLKKKWLKKWSLKLPTPLQKSAKFTAHIMHSVDDPLHFHDLQWKQNLFHTLVEGKVKVVLYPWPDVSSSKTIMP